jgi:hypothetical protein
LEELMNRWLAVGVVFGVVGSLSAGCSSSAAPITLSEFCQQKAQAECSYVVPVCSPLTQTACLSARAAVCTTDANNATSTGNRTFNPGNVGACLNAINAIYSALKFGQNTTLAYSGISGGPTDTSTVDYLCESVFQGQAPANATCTSDFDCTGGNVCTPANGGAKTNVCAPLNAVSSGKPCGGAGDVCVSGSVCQPNSIGEYLCEPSSVVLGGVGAKCSSDADCDPTVAGFCDTYAKTGCQAGYSFGGGADCKAFGL